MSEYLRSALGCDAGTFATSYWYLILIACILLLGTVEYIRHTLQTWRDRKRLNSFRQQCVARRALKALQPHTTATPTPTPAAAAAAEPAAATTSAAVPAEPTQPRADTAPPSPHDNNPSDVSEGGAGAGKALSFASDESAVNGHSFSSSGGSDCEGAERARAAPACCPRYPESVQRTINRQRQENVEALLEARRALETAENCRTT